MGYTLDARGLACPQPVVISRKALEIHDTIVAIVDNMTAVENLRRMAASLNCTISEDRKDDGYYLTITKSPGQMVDAAACTDSTSEPSAGKKRSVLVISQDSMGRGDEKLGKILIRSFFHTLAETPPAPETIIFFNTGVRLVVEGSEVVEDIQTLEKSGTRILSCGTCLDYFILNDRLKAGSITNMYEIKEIMLGGANVTTI